ncbi:MAG: hypothetical protein ACI8PV_002094, partial [Dinoroseobacter sp.]
AAQADDLIDSDTPIWLSSLLLCAVSLKKSNIKIFSKLNYRTL